jgi:Holliday junction DNA helicase RuvA
MIALLNGTVAALEPNAVVLDVGGVGYRVFAPVRTLAGMTEGSRAVLHTAMIVREDDISLYGFGSLDEKRAFDLLIAVNGVGPKVALSVLGIMTVDALAAAAASEDAKAIAMSPGVGPKLAQRIVMEIGDKLGGLHAAAVSVPFHAAGSSVTVTAAEDAVEALVNLGYSRPDSRRAVERVLASTQDAEAGTLVGAALRILSGR